MDNYKFIHTKEVPRRQGTSHRKDRKEIKI
jgi:hypothetical protein